MNWTTLRRMAISLPLAILAASLMIGVSEYGYKQTSQLLTNLTRAHDIRASTGVLIKDMLNAETGLRGYLLTNDTKYLQPYQEASKDIYRSLENIRRNVQHDNQKMDVFMQLSQSIGRKTAEMDLSLKLFREGNADALQFVMFTDMGNSDMNNIRTLSQQLEETVKQEAQHYQDEVQNSLVWARLGVAGMTLIGILAFYLYLRQTTWWNACTSANKPCSPKSVHAWNNWCASAPPP